MQKLLVCLFAFLSFAAQAQVDIVNTSLYKADIRYLYFGVVNIIKVVGLDDNYTLVSSAGMPISKAPASNTFYLLAIKTDGIDTLKIIKNNAVIYKEVFTSELIKEPILRLGTISQPTATVEELSLSKELILVSPDSTLRYSIRSFTFVSGRKPEKDIECLGNGFSPEAFAAIKKLKSGDKVFFENIKVGVPDGTTRTLQSFFLIIR